MFHQIFPSPEDKRWDIFCFKHGICELPNDLRLRKLGNYEILGKCLNFRE